MTDALLHRLASEAGFHGNCFTSAYDRLGALPPSYRPLLVHALPIGTGRANRGRRFWHAWVEAQPRRGGPVLVHDFSNGRRIIAPQATAYAAGQVDPALLWRYTPDEAAAEVARLGTYGPWVDGWEGMGL